MMEEKFIETFDVDDYEVLTDDGWKDIRKIHKTIEYDIWEVKTDNHCLKCADEHIVFDNNYNQIFVKDLKIGDEIITEDGIEKVISVIKTDMKENMYDLELCNESNHRYYTNGILSHNTISTLIYLLWYAMKYPYKEILVTSYSQDSAQKNLNDVKTIYENCPSFIKRGVVSFNESTIAFDNKSKIYSRPTTTKSARGLSPSIIYCDEFAFVGKGESPKKAMMMQTEFYAGISPALSTSKGKLFITSTPLSETDMFYQIWAGANVNRDINGLIIPNSWGIKTSEGLYTDLHKFSTKEDADNYITLNNLEGYESYEIDGVGQNGYGHLFSTWRDMPTRTEEWSKQERMTTGDSFFEREYNCISGDSFVKVMNENGEILNVPLKLLYDYHL